MKQAIPLDGIIVAINAYFRNRNTAHFQIWRPDNITSIEKFKLVHEIAVTPPSVKKNVEVINPIPDSSSKSSDEKYT